jgi:hypothetical protein
MSEPTLRCRSDLAARVCRVDRHQERRSNTLARLKGSPFNDSGLNAMREHRAHPSMIVDSRGALGIRFPWKKAREIPVRWKSRGDGSDLRNAA